MSCASCCARAFVLWLDAPVAILAERTSRRDTRPLLRKGDPRDTLARHHVEPVRVEPDSLPGSLRHAAKARGIEAQRVRVILVHMGDGRSLEGVEGLPIGHAGTTLKDTPAQLAQALSATRPEIEQRRVKRQVRDPDTDNAARTHDSSLFKSLMLTLTKLAQNRLSGIIHHRQSLVHAQVGNIRRTRASSDATPAQETHQQGGTTHTHSMHAPRIPESTAIT